MVHLATLFTTWPFQKEFADVRTLLGVEGRRNRGGGQGGEARKEGRRQGGSRSATAKMFYLAAAVFRDLTTNLIPLSPYRSLMHMNETNAEAQELAGSCPQIQLFLLRCSWILGQVTSQLLVLRWSHSQ